MTSPTIIYLVLSFIQPHVDQVPEITKYDDLQKACDAASRTIFPFTVWSEHVDYTCDRDNESVFQCARKAPTVTINRMICVSSPNFKLEPDIQ